MARGTYGGGQIELHVYAEDLDPADEVTIDRWKESFEVASGMLFHATDKQAHFAKVYLYAGGNGANDPDNCDARISNALESSYASEHPTVSPEEGDDPDAFLEDTFMALGKDSFDSPFVILHEFGHFGYWLGDEYRGDKPTLCTAKQRIGPAARGDVAEDGEHSCIMGVPTLGAYNVTRFVNSAVGPGYWVRHGWIVEFCNEDNHNDSNGSNHNSIYGNKSCKEVIAELRQINVATGVTVAKADGEMAPYPEVKWPPTSDDSETDVIVDSSLGPVIGSLIDDLEDWIFEAGAYGTQFASSTDRISLFKFGDSEGGPRFKPMPDVGDALDVVARDLASQAQRPAVQSVLLFSTGREPIQDARRIASAFASNGGRVFSFGLGQDRAALQLIAQRSGGAYFEVDVNDARRTPAENAQLVRAEMARAYDGSRFGAPIAIVPRAELAADEVRLRVEEGSKHLKLVFAKTPGSDPTISVHPPAGRTQRLERTKSEDGGFETVSVGNPAPGEWTIALQAGALPKAIDLSAYSDNRRISVGVTGRRRRRLVWETVTLQVVVRAPFAVVDLDTAEARVTPPSGGYLQIRALRPRRDGVHTVQFRVSEAGAYDVEVRIQNRGRARLAGQRFSSSPSPTVPLFERVRRFQIHVATS